MKFVNFRLSKLEFLYKFYANKYATFFEHTKNIQLLIFFFIFFYLQGVTYHHLRVYIEILQLSIVIILFFLSPFYIY